MHRKIPEIILFDLSVRKTTAGNVKMLEDMTSNIETLTGQLRASLSADDASKELAFHVKALIK
jgi:hypothetical protein